MDKVKKHAEICKQLNDIYSKKNADYGDSFGLSFQKYGVTAPMIRMEDKWNRLNNLILNPEQAKINESVEDTLLDLANYAIMTYMELSE